MPASDNTVRIRARELKGSRLRCLMLTSMPPSHVARALNDLMHPHGWVNSAKDSWAPGGFLAPAEAKLGESTQFLDRRGRDILTDWWLDVKPSANTPNWDLVSTCTIESQRGLLLVEAKAHRAELSSTGKSRPTSPNSMRNHRRIEEAIEQANAGLKAMSHPASDWALSHDSHYQLSNRFAWSWKIASMGVPVILLYLGFLRADEMSAPFASPSAWRQAVEAYSTGIVPRCAWEGNWLVGETPFFPIIRSLDMRWVNPEHLAS